jgi:beta-glucosidase
MNVARIPRGGRNFEYVSGEDPYLGSKLVKPAIEGI